MPDKTGAEASEAEGGAPDETPVPGSTGVREEGAGKEVEPEESKEERGGAREEGRDEDEGSREEEGGGKGADGPSEKTRGAK